MDLVGEDVPVEAAAHGRWGENALGWNTVWSPMHKAKGVEITAGGACAKLVSDGYMPRPRELGGMSDAEYGSVRGVRAIPRKGSTYFEVCVSADRPVSLIARCSLCLGLLCACDLCTVFMIAVFIVLFLCPALASRRVPSPAHVPSPEHVPWRVFPLGL